MNRSRNISKEEVGVGNGDGCVGVFGNGKRSAEGVRRQGRDCDVNVIVQLGVIKNQNVEMNITLPLSPLPLLCVCLRCILLYKSQPTVPSGTATEGLIFFRVAFPVQVAHVCY